MPILTRKMDTLDLLGDFEDELDNLDPFRIINDDETDFEEVSFFYFVDFVVD